MKPSRALYLITGAAIASAPLGEFPGNGGFLTFVAVVCGAAAVFFDWRDA